MLALAIIYASYSGRCLTCFSRPGVWLAARWVRWFVQPVHKLSSLLAQRFALAVVVRSHTQLPGVSSVNSSRLSRCVVCALLLSIPRPYAR